MDDDSDARQRSLANLKPFQPGNPGRQKGSRNKLGEQFIADLYADWLEHGAAAIAKVREERPQDYLKVVASILPRQIDVKSAGPFSEFTDEQLEALAASAKHALGLVGEDSDEAGETIN